MTVKLLCDYPPYKVGNLFTSDSNTETGLVNQHMATSDLTGGTTYVAPAVRATGAWIPLTRDKTIEAADDGRCYAAVNAITVTWPAGLTPRPTVCLMPPASGNLTLAGQVTGTRARAGNPAGIVVSAYQDSDAYGASGS